ncbi:TraV family lipoprotein, partial [Azohydromonas aeria]|uniref:TraV family lipoprotein n=1 Tax=Azohydromonas aeria TaxID=2590212 RepID=UPI0012FAA093
MSRGPDRARLAAAIAAVLCGACTNLSGLDGSSSYACKAPAGVACQSVSGTYANALASNLPAQRARTGAPGPATAGPAPAAAALPATAPGTPGSPASALRSPPRILRLWFKPWEDADRDLYDQGYVYVQIDGGRWLVDHAQRLIRDAYAPVRPPVAVRTPAAAPASATPPAGPAPAGDAPRPGGGL